MLKRESGFTTFETVLGVVMLVVLAAVGWKVYNAEQTKSSNDYFQKLAQTTETYYHEQAAALGIEVSKQDLVKSCYQTEQGPFDNGHQFCGIKVEKKITVKADNTYVSGLLVKLDKVIKHEGFFVDGGNTTVTSLRASYGAVKSEGSINLCTVQVVYPPISDGDNKTAMGYELNCSKESSKVPAGFSVEPSS